MIKNILCMIIVFLLILPEAGIAEKPNIYRARMCNFVRELSRYVKKYKPGFIVIVQNAPNLLARENNINRPDKNYLSAIDGIGIESLYYSHNGRTVNKDDIEYKNFYLKYARRYRKKVLVIDYCKNKDKIHRSIKKNGQMGYISYQAPSKSLDEIQNFPVNIQRENKKHIMRLNEAENFLYLINPSKFRTKRRFVNYLKNTNYDILIIDGYFNGKPLSRRDIRVLKRKKNGKRRLVISYMSIGEAEDYRFYWNKRWKRKKPSWIEHENPDWKGNFIVRYWYNSWKNIIFGKADSYLNNLVRSGFDGVYLDTLDSWENF